MNRIARYLAATLTLISTLCFAQLDRGTVTGTVTDATGAVVPGTKITIRNKATNATYQTLRPAPAITLQSIFPPARTI